MTFQRLSAKQIQVLETSLVFAAGLALFFMRFGMQVLDPAQIDWLLSRDDPAAYYLIWDSFRYEPWTFPLGQVSSYLYPLGTSLPLADGLPLLAYPAKIFSPLLPDVFQFFGLWHLICAGLQGYFGYRILRHGIAHSTGRVLGALLFLLAPIFLFREGHIALSGHWVLLAAMDLYLDDRGGGWRRIPLRWCALVAVTALIHPYLVAMVLLILAGWVGKRDKDLRWPSLQRLATPVASVSVLFLVWWLAGNFQGLSSERVQATGFGYFSLNLNGFFNSLGFGTLFPRLPLERGQYEGYAYLGAGWLLLAAMGILALAFSRDLRSRLRGHLVLASILLATFFFALSNTVMWNNTMVAQFMQIPALDLLTGVYRCSGRFVWPVIYAGMAGLIMILSRLRSRRLIIGILTTALALQVWDIRPFIFRRDYFATMDFQSQFQDPNWDTAASASTGITTIPPFQFSLEQKADYRDICWLAAQHRIPSTAGYAARMSTEARALADSMRSAIAGGTADRTNLYICSRSVFPGVLADFGESYVGAAWDGYLVCYPREWPLENRIGYRVTQRPSLAEFLESRQDRTLILAVRDEASAGLVAADRQAMRHLGIDEATLAYRSAFGAIVHGGQTLWQRTESGKRIEFDLAAGDSLGTFFTARAIHVVSAGFDAGNTAQLLLDGNEEGFGARGFNILVLDEEQQLVEIAWFDSHKGLPGVVLQKETHTLP